MEMLIDGEYVSDMDSENVINPYNAEVIDTVIQGENVDIQNK